MPKVIPKNKRREAECAAEWYAHEDHFCVLTRRAVRTQWQKVDFFGADVVGKTASGQHVYLQVTAGQSSAVTARRRKLEAIPWHKTDTVELLQLIQTEDPANARRKLWWFRVHRFAAPAGGARVWETDEEAVRVPREWFRARKDGSDG